MVGEGLASKLGPKSVVARISHNTTLVRSPCGHGRTMAVAWRWSGAGCTTGLHAGPF